MKNDKTKKDKKQRKAEKNSGLPIKTEIKAGSQLEDILYDYVTFPFSINDEN